ncbi:MAG: hypothetical protein Ta2A_14230 [Treponemataceae bacterium]|nr:MAG: hypothetical protein Ta2A_14230 [Treponemataceae bacterium]
MNTNLVAIVKKIIADYGENILANPQRLKSFFSDLAKDEPKPLRVAFGRCIEAGAYAALKAAPDAGERASRKASIAQRLRDDMGLDAALCAEALDVLEAALFGGVSSPPAAPPEYRQSAGQQAQTAYVPPSASARTSQYQQPMYTNVYIQQNPQTAAQISVGGKKISRNVLIGAGVAIAVLVVVVIALVSHHQPDQVARQQDPAPLPPSRQQDSFTLPSLCRGWPIGGTTADIYFCETTSKANVNGTVIDYWLYNTYKYSGGKGVKLFEIIFDELQKVVEFDLDESEHFSPNTALHENVKKMMLNTIDGEWHDVSVCLNNGSIIINNYNRDNKLFDTWLIPYTME